MAIRQTGNMSTTQSVVIVKTNRIGPGFTDHLNRYWLVWFSILYGIFVSLPWLAPVLMKIGAVELGRAIYTVYSFPDNL